LFELKRVAITAFCVYDWKSGRSEFFRFAADLLQKQPTPTRPHLGEGAPPADSLQKTGDGQSLIASSLLGLRRESVSKLLK
jgi:hypothetical protein